MAAETLSRKNAVLVCGQVGAKYRQVPNVGTSHRKRTGGCKNLTVVRSDHGTEADLPHGHLLLIRE
ncbi:hypothetical protein [Acidovorax sp. A1169]|uniref:hypothetical protein n=1 Tax=Acidovorax sp. A1169 TaxID=3059524 RepID=UPI002737F5F9|nr:hypothetical protein [Acidovorax sp. A1169]MDP4074599.1 hypothetical protein [Acidovorax sp. A1169]